MLRARTRAIHLRHKSRNIRADSGARGVALQSFPLFGGEAEVGWNAAPGEVFCYGNRIFVEASLDWKMVSRQRKCTNRSWQGSIHISVLRAICSKEEWILGVPLAGGDSFLYDVLSVAEWNRCVKTIASWHSLPLSTCFAIGTGQCLICALAKNRILVIKNKNLFDELQQKNFLQD